MKAQTVSFLVKQLMLLFALARDPWIFNTMRNNICFCCKSKKKNQPKNLFMYFQASLTIEIIYTILNAVT